MAARQKVLRCHHKIDKFEHIMNPAERDGRCAMHECRTCGLREECTRKTDDCLRCIQAQEFMKMRDGSRKKREVELAGRKPVHRKTFNGVRDAGPTGRMKAEVDARFKFGCM